MGAFYTQFRGCECPLEGRSSRLTSGRKSRRNKEFLAFQFAQLVARFPTPNVALSSTIICSLGGFAVDQPRHRLNCQLSLKLEDRWWRQPLNRRLLFANIAAITKRFNFLNKFKVRIRRPLRGAAGLWGYWWRFV
jgi:hypothetical protein